MLPPIYTVNVTRGEILHVGESLSNLTLSEGDTLRNSSDVTITELVCLYIFNGLEFKWSILVQTMSIH